MRQISLRATSVAWNAQGTSLAIGYSHVIHTGFCTRTSVVHVWGVFRSDATKPIHEVETEGSVTAMSFHPFLPTVLAVGTYNGQIFLYDFGRSEPLVS
jgi:WD40 repeat protein